MAMESKHGICGICPAGCWVKVGVEDGRLVSIEADDGHPLGMICRRGENAPEIVHSENRLRYPMRRVGPKGTHEFERISWDEAYEGIVAGMEGIRERYGAEAMSIYTGRGAFELSLCDVYQPAEAAVSSASSVLFPFGSPNTMGVGALCYVSFAMIAPHVTMGRMLVDMYTDIENADLLVIWGANPATDSPPLDMYRLEAARRRGAEVVVIDPRRSETAVRTGAEWVPIRPGTDGALALGMLHVLIEEELFDEGFARDWTRGFNELCTHAQHYPPQVVEAITGVPAQTVIGLARRIAAAGGAAPIMYTGLEYSNSGVQAIRAVLTLFALAGQLDVPGGIGLAMKQTHFPINRSQILPNPDLDRAVARDRFPLYSNYRGESHALGLIDAVLHDRPYPIRGLIVHGGSILTSWPQSAVWRETLSKLELLVSIDRQLTADAAYADYVLPATTMFEISSYMTYGPIFRLRERLIEPVGEARNDYTIMAELASRLGYGHLYPQDEEALLEHVLEGSGFTLEQVRAAAGTVKIPSPMMEYRKWEKGGLRPDGQPGFDTPSGRFEIASSLLEDHGYEPLPLYTEPTEGPLARPDLAREFPLVFNSGARRQSFFRSQHHGIRGLNRDHLEPLVEMHPDDAAPRGIGSGDLVEVATPRGLVRFRAAVTEEIVRGAIECDMGGGGAVGPKAWRESNVNELTDLGNLDEISGFPVYKCLLAEVRKVAEGGDAARVRADRATERTACAGPVPGFGAGSTVAVAPILPEHRSYLDNNATTELAAEARQAMAPFFETEHGNPSSIHTAGARAGEAVERARRQVARLIGARPRRVVFTGGGSEADNLALKGIAFRHAGGRLITSTVEHPAVLEAIRFLERRGFPVSWLEVDGEGRVEPDGLAAALDQAARAGEPVRLVSVMAANNEVGTLQPIRRLAALAHQHGALFHTDAVQAAGKIALDVETLGVDLLTLSAHKFHGPKGVGALYVRQGIELEPLVHGGQQEGGQRAGTENVAAIVGMGAAAERARIHGLPCMAEVRRRRDRLQEIIERLVPEARLNGALDSAPENPRRLPNTLNLTLPGLRGESLVIALDRKGIALSSGSACKSGSPAPSHALLALGLSEADAHCAIRLSLSEATTDEEVERFGEALAGVLEEMETTVRFLPCK
jgi:cysteine sulfinate desulfinase/cysteine desulfurase-like protein/anaerobic selenocysteine-containing dehydrogenase